MTMLKLFFSKRYLFQTFLSAKTAKTLFALLGAAWTIVEASAFFWQEHQELLRSAFPWLLLGSAILTLILQRPVVRVSARLNSQDVQVEVIVGDALKLPGATVVTVCTAFDTTSISDDSLQGQVTRKYFSGNAQFLQEQFRSHLPSPPSSNRYPVGTVAHLRHGAESTYFLAVASRNANGNTSASLDDVRTALPGLWEAVAERGDPDTLVVPLIGTGRARVMEGRSIIAREIIDSFLASCSYSRFCKRLTVVIHPTDFIEHNIDIVELGTYLQFRCKYIQIQKQATVEVGTPTS